MVSAQWRRDGPILAWGVDIEGVDMFARMVLMQLGILSFLVGCAQVETRAHVMSEPAGKTR